MDTFVEFFSDEALENVMVLLKYKPGRIIYLGHKHMMITKKIESLARFAKVKSPDTALEFIEVPRDDLDELIRVLNNIIEKYPDACFEMTGGGEMILMAFGYVSAGKNLNTLRIDPYTSVEVNFKSGAKPTRRYDAINMSVADNMLLHGGALTKLTGNFSTWNFTDEFRQDIKTIWKIARSLKHKWNSYCAVIEECIKNNPPDESGLYTLPKTSLKGSAELFYRLRDAGMLRGFDSGAKTIKFRFKNDMIRSIVTKTGNILELHVYEVATRSVTFNDAIISAVIDWDSEVKRRNADGTVSRISLADSSEILSSSPGLEYQTYDTINEIDVILMKGVIPTFISCKSGKAGSNALHELQTITRRFGGNYAKKALVMAAPADKAGSSESFFKQRAKDMHIWVIDDVYNMSDEALLSKLIRIQGS